MQVKVTSSGDALREDPEFQRWFGWALPNVGGDHRRAELAALTALTALRAGADEATAAAAAQRAAENAPPQLVPAAAPRVSWLRRFGPVVVVFAAITVVFGLIGGLLAAGALWVMEQTWRSTLPAWLRVVLIGFTGLVAMIFYVILTGILELLQRS